MRLAGLVVVRRLKGGPAACDAMNQQLGTDRNGWLIGFYWFNCRVSGVNGGRMTLSMRGARAGAGSWSVVR